MKSFLSGSSAKRKEEQRKALERQRREEEKLKEHEDMVEKLLPWGLEQKVAVSLNPIKVPFVLAVGILGCVVENKIAAISDGAFSRGWFQTGPQCMVHVANHEKLLLNHPYLNKLAEELDNMFAPAIHYVNRTALSNKRCFIEDNVTRCEFFNTSWVNITFDKDMCGVTFDHQRHRCIQPDEFPENQFDRYGEEDNPGIERRLPFLPYAFLWMVFKLVFLPVHVVDRVANMAAGYPQPMEEPMFKLLTEPYCAPNTSLGKLCGLFRPLALISRCIRFSLLPNSLILPLVTLRHVSQCPDYIIYTQDVKFSYIIYYWLLFDLFSIVGLYVIGKTVCGGHAISRMWYRAYKCIQVPLTLISLILFVLDLVTILNWRFWQGLAIVLRIMFTLKLSFNFTLDVTQTLANAVIIVDGLQLAILIMSFVCPRMLSNIPLPEWIQEWVQRPEDTISNESQPESSVQMAEREDLLAPSRATTSAASSSQYKPVSSRAAPKKAALPNPFGAVGGIIKNATGR